MSSGALAAAESKMKALEERIVSLESNSDNDSLSNRKGASSTEVEVAVKAYQKQMLSKLKQIRDSLNEEGGDIQSVTKERDQLLQENKQLKAEVEKLNYRVRHLIKSLNEEEEISRGKKN
jgi:uncharacterized coiled-coil DUF342 family protein